MKALAENQTQTMRHEPYKGRDMKLLLKLQIMVCLAVSGVPAVAQELTLVRGDKTIPGRQIDAESWEFQLDGESYLLVKRAWVQEMARMIEILQSDTARYREILAAKDTLLQKFETFQQKADEHIEVQQRIIKTADTLYTGYKDLYHDLKRLYGLSNFALMAGVGVIDPPGGSWRPVGSIGLGINNWVTQFQIGDDYKGLVVGLRWPFGF